MEAMESSRHLTFSVAGDRYAIRVENVREVLENERITRLPGAPPELLGIINLRGSSVPVVDLRLKLGVGGEGKRTASAIIVLELGQAERRRLVGALADEVHEVVDIPAPLVDAAPARASTLEAGAIEGVVVADDGFIVLLDAARVLGDSDGDDVCAGDELGPVGGAGTASEADA